MNKKKKRMPIKRLIAARVLFGSDRTCCVCRIRSKPVQIHHIDDNRNNNAIGNLAILCFDCHGDTQLRGGFGRKLEAEQVILYRDDWNIIVASTRVTKQIEHVKEGPLNKFQLQVATSLAEIYRQNKEFGLLAMHYNSLDNVELRDKYIELAIAHNTNNQMLCFLRGLQGKPELIPDDIVKKELKRYSKDKDWLQRARLYNSIGSELLAARDYIQGILKSLKEDNVFTAAFYLKEMMTEKFVDKLFEEAFRRASDENDLWWQIRALEELGWISEIDELILDNEAEILESDDLELLQRLAMAKDEPEKAIELIKEEASRTHSEIYGIVIEKNNDKDSGSACS